MDLRGLTYVSLFSVLEGERVVWVFRTKLIKNAQSFVRVGWTWSSKS